MSVYGDDIRELAAKTAAEIRRRGWTHGEFYDDTYYEDDGEETCKVCPLAALGWVIGRNLSLYDTNTRGVDGPPLKLVNAFVDEAPWDGRFIDDPDIAAEPFGLVVTFNDSIADSADDVLAVLDRIAGTDQ